MDVYHNIIKLLNNKHYKIQEIMLEFFANNKIIDYKYILALFYNNDKIINIIDTEIETIKYIEKESIKIIKKYIINDVLADILTLDYKQGSTLSSNHHIAIRLRTHNKLRILQLQSIYNVK